MDNGIGSMTQQLEVFSEDIPRAGSTIYVLFGLYFRITTSQNLVGS